MRHPGRNEPEVARRDGMPVLADPQHAFTPQHEVQPVPVVRGLRVAVARLEMQDAGCPVRGFVKPERVLVGEPRLLEEPAQREELRASGYMHRPPSTSNTVPVTIAASSDARKSAAFAR